MACCVKGSRPAYFSLLGLGLCWIGITLFCVYVYPGQTTAEFDTNRDIFNQARRFFHREDKTLIIFAIICLFLTFLMALHGFIASHNEGRYRRGKVPSRLSERFVCKLVTAILILINAALFIIWLGILTTFVALFLSQDGLSGLCIEDLSSTGTYCFNVNAINGMVQNAKNKARGLTTEEPKETVTHVNKMCHEVLNDFCSFIDQYVPWYAYAGALAALLGLYVLNGAMAANFAYGNQPWRETAAKRYVMQPDEVDDVKARLYYSPTSMNRRRTLDLVDTIPLPMMPQNRQSNSPDHYEGTMGRESEMKDHKSDLSETEKSVLLSNGSITTHSVRATPV